MPVRIIAHLDMDAFFAAIEERANPRWRGRPLVVGADPRGGTGRGVVSTANYAARAYGIHSALPIRQAWQLAQIAHAAGKPAVIFVPGSWSRYAATSRRIMDRLTRVVPLVEQRSVDEAYLELSFLGSWHAAEAFCRQLQQEIVRDEGLTASIGVGPSKLIAKIAANLHKPAGLTVVEPRTVISFLAPLSVRALPGVGPVTERALARLGMTTVAQVQERSPAELEERLGQFGTYLAQIARGADERPLGHDQVAKSIGHHRTFYTDTLVASFLLPTLLAMCDDVFQRLSHDGFHSFRTVVVTARFADFTTISRRRTTRDACASLRQLQVMALRLLLPFLDRRENPRLLSLRLIGVRLERLQ